MKDSPDNTPYFDPYKLSLAGCLLVAHPDTLGIEVNKKVVLISTHTQKEGGMGVVINHPISECLAEYDTSFKETPIGGISLYYGGPKDRDQMILTAWDWQAELSFFKLHFGLTYDKACELLDKKPQTLIRGFLGCLHWSYQQLSDEVLQGKWLITPIDEMAMHGEKKEDLWLYYVKKIKPELVHAPETPKDPSLN